MSRKCFLFFFFFFFLIKALFLKILTKKCQKSQFLPKKLIHFWILTYGTEDGKSTHKMGGSVYCCYNYCMNLWLQNCRCTVTWAYWVHNVWRISHRRRVATRWLLWEKGWLPLFPELLFLQFTEITSVWKSTTVYCKVGIQHSC